MLELLHVFQTKKKKNKKQNQKKKKDIGVSEYIICINPFSNT